MYSNIITAIRREIINELRKRVLDEVYIFRETDENGDEQIYCDLSVGFPDEMEYYPDVVSVFRKGYEACVKVRDAECNDRDIKITDVELSTDELAEILDAIMYGVPTLKD